jgi:hypothetical protein
MLTDKKKTSLTLQKLYATSRNVQATWLDLQKKGMGDGFHSLDL